MTAYKGSKDATHVLVGGVNVSPVIESLGIKESAILDERRFLGTTWPTQCDTGHRKAELTMAGVLNSPTTDGIATLNASGAVVSALLSGNAVDMDFYGFQSAILSGIDLALSPEKVDEITPEFTITGEFNRGTVVAPYASRTTDDNTDATWSTRPASASASGHAYLNVGAYTGGATKLVVKVRTSATHASFADLATFPDVTAVGGQVLTIASGILEHLSISWALTDGTNPAFSGFVGVAVD